MKVKCPRCQRRKALKHSQYGYVFCKVCQNQEHGIKRGVEFTTRSIKDQRREYRKDILQPFHDGILSKEYVEEYGTNGIKASKKDIKNAKYVYKQIPGWWERQKSKGGRKRL